MKIKPSTLFLVLAALVLGGIVLVVQQQPAPKSADSQTESATSEEAQPIFGIQEADIQAFTLQTRLHTLKFERNKDGKWQMLEPDKTAASDPSVAFLLDLVATGKSDRTLTAPAAEREQYGLHQPIATIDLRLKDQKTHKLVIGEYDFNRSHLYAQVDPPANPSEPLKLLLVSPNFDNAVNRPLDEWKQPTAAQKSNPKDGAEKSQAETAKPSSPAASPTPASKPTNSKASPAPATPKPSP